ncbi:MAG: energy transducer TonB [Alphaproteobacteria bacterium]
MRTAGISYISRALVFVVCVLALAVSRPAYAAPSLEPEGCEAFLELEAQASPAVLQALAAVPRDMRFVNIPALRSSLTDLFSRSDLTGTDHVVISLALVHIDWADKSYDRALKTLEALYGATDCMQPAWHADELRVTIGTYFLQAADVQGLHVGDVSLRRGVAILQGAIRDKPQAPPLLFGQIAGAYLAMATPELEKALEWFEKAIDQADKVPGTTPMQTAQLKENWLAERVRLLIRLERFEEAVPALETLLRDYDRQFYWMQLAYLYGELGQADRQLAMMAPGLKAGLFKRANEYAYAFQLNMLTRDPDAAAATLELGLSRGILNEEEAAHFQVQLEKYLNSDDGTPADRGAYPMFRTQPRFPLYAQWSGTSGCVIYEFTISEHGRPVDIHTIDSSHAMFDRYGVRAIEQFRYFPRLADGIAVAAPDQTIRLVWALEGEGLPEHPSCPDASGENEEQLDDLEDRDEIDPFAPLVAPG